MFLSYKKRKFKIEKAITFKTIGDFELKGDVYRPNAPGLKPAILVVHGGGWFKKSGDMQSLCKRLARDGFVVFNATYRLAPKHTYPSAVDDLRDALAWLKVCANKYEIDINKISGWGYSAGAHLLLLVGLNPEANLKALVCGGTPADFS
ncbi:MAG: alpha/beta hydrolase, partial [Bdellovibrionaceae bacterium]|nr:alpha/beta hydrolase [Bdellovibrio sp.]